MSLIIFKNQIKKVLSYARMMRIITEKQGKPNYVLILQAVDLLHLTLFLFLSKFRSEKYLITFFFFEGGC